MAGRGIDIHDVSMVLNYDMAKNIEGMFSLPSLSQLLSNKYIYGIESIHCFFFSLLIDKYKNEKG